MTLTPFIDVKFDINLRPDCSGAVPFAQNLEADGCSLVWEPIEVLGRIQMRKRVWVGVMARVRARDPCGISHRIYATERVPKGNRA